MFKKGFTLTELLVVIAIIGILATIIMPVVPEAITKAKIAKVAAMVSGLETACDRYYMDTGRYAIEYGLYPTYQDKAYHGLSVNDGAANWAGPYIKKPLTSADSPFTTSFVYMYAYLSGGTCSPGSFDLNGDGTDDRSGAGNFLCLPNVGEVNSKKIDQLYDKGIAGDWNTTGKVEYNAEQGGMSFIYLTGGS